MKKPWSKEEEYVLACLLEKKATLTEMSEKLGRSPGSCRLKAARLGYSLAGEWDKEEISVLIDGAKKGIDYVCAQIGRKRSEVRSMAKKLAIEVREPELSMVISFSISQRAAEVVKEKAKDARMTVSQWLRSQAVNEPWKGRPRKKFPVGKPSTLLSFQISEDLHKAIDTVIRKRWGRRGTGALMREMVYFTIVRMARVDEE